MNGVCRSIRIIMTLQLTLIISEVDLIIKFLNPASRFLVTIQKVWKKQKQPRVIIVFSAKASESTYTVFKMPRILLKIPSILNSEEPSISKFQIRNN